MALLGTAANIAQLLGGDIFGLIRMIVKSALTVRRNEEACRQLSDRASMIKDRLQQLQQVSRAFEHPEMWKPIRGLRRTLCSAHKLILACQHSSYMYKLCMGCELAGQFKSVQKEMDAWNQHLSDIILGIMFNAITVILAPSLNGDRNTIKQGKTKWQLGQLQLVTEPHTLTEEHWPAVGYFYRTRDLDHVFCMPQDDNVKKLSTENQISRCSCWCPNISYKGTGLTKFSFSQLEHATNYFSLENEIGFGGSSSVYKGQINTGHFVAVKRASYEENITFKQFENEIELIPKIHHPNIVKLVGYCVQKGERILVFEYMPNGSLDSFIYGVRALEALKWPQRRHIIEGIAQGAKYLHQQCEPRIVHGDLKPGNILLDSDFNPKICDFGTSKALKLGADEYCTGIITGSRGFIAPEYIRQGCLSMKSDVYSFGVTLLQIISRKRLPPPPLALSAESRDYGPLNKWAWDLCVAGGLLEFIDRSMHGEPHQNAEIMRWAQIALLCVQESPEERPNMSDVLLMLSSEDDIPKQPNQPAYY